MTPAESKRTVAYLLALFPSAKVQDSAGGAGGTLEAYQSLLADLPYEPAMAAVQRVAGTHRYPTVLPSIAEIREATLALTSGERRPGVDAWGDVLRAISRYGHLRTPGVDFDFLDPVVARCVSQLGWRQLCDSECVQADRARFVQLYDELALQYRRGMLTDTLPAVTRYRTLAASPVVDVVANSLAAPRKPL